MAANNAAYLKPAANEPSLTFPMKNPDIQVCRMMPMENSEFCNSKTAIGAVEVTSETEICANTKIVNATIVVVKAMSTLQTNAKIMYGLSMARLFVSISRFFSAYSASNSRA